MVSDPGGVPVGPDQHRGGGGDFADRQKFLCTNHFGVPSHVGESGQPRGIADPVVGPVDGDQTFGQITQGGVAARSKTRATHST